MCHSVLFKLLNEVGVWNMSDESEDKFFDDEEDLPKKSFVRVSCENIVLVFGLI